MWLNSQQNNEVETVHGMLSAAFKEPFHESGGIRNK